MLQLPSYRRLVPRGHGLEQGIGKLASQRRPELRQALCRPQVVQPVDVPKSALDFLKPAFRGKVVAAYPADDDATLYAFHTVVKKYGWQYMDKYMANQPTFIQGHLGAQRSISSGENWVTLDALPQISMVEKRAGKPHEIAFPESDLLPIWPLTAAIFRIPRI